MNPFAALAVAIALTLAGVGAFVTGERALGVALVVASTPFDLLFALGLARQRGKERP